MAGFESRKRPGCLDTIPDSGPLRFRDEDLAPEVDRELLWALVRQELEEHTARAVYRLVYSFQSWNDAHTEILVGEFHRREGRDAEGRAGE